MTATRVCISTVILVVGLALAPVAGVALADGTVILENVVDGDEEATDESSMGAEVSTFMQASATDASESTDRGMFEAAYETADEDERADLLAQQTAAFTSKYDRLESQLEELEAQKENDDITPIAYDAQLTRITVQLSSLESSINETEPRAEAAGIDTSELDEIRENTRDLAGPEVARIATDLDGIDPPGHQNDPVAQDRNSSEIDQSELDEESAEFDSDELGYSVDAAEFDSDELGYDGNASDIDTDPPGNDGNSSDTDPPGNDGNSSDTDPPGNDENASDSDTDPPGNGGNASDTDTDPPGNGENSSDSDTDPSGLDSGLSG